MTASTDSPDWIDALQTPAGKELLRLLAAEPPEPGNELRTITRLRASFPAELVSTALTQIRLRERARAKFTMADGMFFTQAGLEQASSERMASHHEERFKGLRTMADLCTGIGGDLIALARHHRVIAVDSDPMHLRIASLNAQVNGVGDNVVPICDDVRNVDLSGVDGVFVDPARRSADRRFRAGTSEPPLEWCFDLARRVPAIGIKAAPGLPVDVVPEQWELEFVSERRELKESLLWSPSLSTTRRRATILPEAVTLVERPGATLPVDSPGNYLLDPDAAVTRAGLVETLGEALGDCWKIDAQIAFLCADVEISTPFARTLKVEASLPWNLSHVRDALRKLKIGVVDIRKRGSAVDVDELQRKLKLSGDRSAVLVLTRVSDRPWALVCTSPATGPTAAM